MHLCYSTMLSALGHEGMIDHPSYTIILQIHTFNHPKVHSNATVSTANSPIFLQHKVYRKIDELIGMWVRGCENGGARCA